MYALSKRSYNTLRQHIKKEANYFTNRCLDCHTMVCAIVIYVWECWTIKKAKCQRTDAFELWCCRRLLRVPWTATSSQSNQKKSVLIMHWEDWCGSWSSKTLVPLCEEPQCVRTNPAVGNTERQRRRESRGWVGCMALPIQWAWIWTYSERWRSLVCCDPHGGKDLYMIEWRN